MLKQYPSINSMAQEYKTLVLKDSAPSTKPLDSWYNNESEIQILNFCQFGKTDLVPEAERQLALINSEIQTSQKLFLPSVCGPTFNIPEYLSNVPTHMRRRETISNENAPINIYVTTTSSAGISANILQRRGITILALVMALSQMGRTITLHQLTCVEGKDYSGETILTAQINTMPLDLATACYVLTSSGFDRKITHSLATKLNGFVCSWPRKMDYFNPQPYYNYLKNLISPDPKRTLIIGAAQLGDQLLTNPILWINTQIKHFTSLENNLAA